MGSGGSPHRGGATASKTRLPQKGACQINKWQERDWGHLPPLRSAMPLGSQAVPGVPCRESERGEKNRRDCKISPTKARQDRGPRPSRDCCSPNKPWPAQSWLFRTQRCSAVAALAAAAAPTIQALSSSVADVGRCRAPSKQFPHPHRPEPCNFQHQSILNLALPRLALSCTTTTTPPTRPPTTAVARSIFVPVDRSLLLSLVPPYSQLLSLLNSRDNA